MDLARRLKPQHLRLIVKIAESGKLQIAAGALAISQPAASRILAELETDLGTKLFDRHPKGMVPTAIGQAFLQHGRAILATLDSLETEVEDLKEGQSGEVRVGSVTGPAVQCLVPAVQAVRAASPGVEVTIEVGPSTELVRGLEEGRFEFVLARLPQDYDPRAFDIQPARFERVALLVHDSHPLAGQRGLTLDRLAEHDWVIQERGSPIRAAVEAAFHEAAVPVPSGITNSSSLLVMLALLENSAVIAPVAEEVAALLTRPGIGARLRRLDVDRPIAVTPYFIIRNRARQFSTAVDRVLTEVLARL
ncbi:LysR family transcriptional regulator [Marinibacterium profundimaris]|uniref:Transcriptional regulator n=1 Tax=Marinibacterium profundimaris TaxID=1679460 RepID=A0A225NRY1_9RHOB|nr:LysR family transcriptional regulator [Marinibacterium profundimaris]OWU77704.1 transcriptional regulator [Marinibacterium profundimaris]